MFIYIKKFDDYYHHLLLRDTCFTTYFNVFDNVIINHILIVEFFIQEYKTRNLNIIRNLIRYYEYLNRYYYTDIAATIVEHRNTIHPSFNYNNQYYPILKQQPFYKKCL